MNKEKTFWFQVGDEATLTVDEIWPDGDAPENPTLDDVIQKVREYGQSHFATDWGFQSHLNIDGKEVW